MNKYSKYDECNFEGIWETSVKPYHISLNIHQIRIYFYKRNPKVYRICMNFPEIGTVLFSPVWQRLVNGTMLINLLWKNDKTINFMLRIQDDHLDGNITQDNVIIPISLQRICLKAPSIDDGCLVLSKIWRYELLVYNREYGTYGLDNNEMSFTYSDMNHPLSCNLRTHYKLDCMIDSENDFKTILNIMRWVNSVLKHNGMQVFVGKREAGSILSSHPGMASCRGLAIVLCEALLAVGIKSRFVICEPAEEPFDECHAVCIAFSRVYNKWVMVDPTNNLYIMNERKRILDIKEFRECLINNTPFFINEDTNWNGTKITKNQYCDYMVKNMVRFNCMRHYYPGCDQKGIDKVTLIPKHYLPNSTDSSIQVYDEKIFWA